MKLSTSTSITNELNEIDVTKNQIVQKHLLIRIDEVSKITTLAKPTIMLWVAQKKFPPPIPLSHTVKTWRLHDVTNWIESHNQG